LPPYKIPLVGRLYGNTGGASGQSERFYERIRQANAAENEIKGRVRAGIAVADYLADHPGAIELAARGNVAERQCVLIWNADAQWVSRTADRLRSVREMVRKWPAPLRVQAIPIP
jgi:hypothetical protein